MIYHSEGTFKGVGGLDLYYQSWIPGGEIRAILTIVHGLGAHSGRFSNIVEHLLPKQYAIYALDLRGHGRSPGQRGYINAWAEFREDLGKFLNYIQQQESDCPIFLLGHSLGGLIVIDYTLRYPQEASRLQGVITLAPSIGEVGVSPLRILLGKLLTIVWPNFSLNTGLDKNAGSRNENIAISYAEDKLMHSRATARLSTEFLAIRDWIHKQAANWHVPLLILHGTGDTVALPEGSEIFYQKITYSDKLRIEYPGAYHEIHSDINYQEVMVDLENWLEQHLPIEMVKLKKVGSRE